MKVPSCVGTQPLASGGTPLPDPTTKNPTPRPIPRKGQVYTVHIARNGMLSAYDENGTDLTQFGGPSEECLPLIQQTCNPFVTRD